MKPKDKLRVNVARAGKQPKGSNSGIFSNSGYGQKMDNKRPKTETQAYAVTPGAHRKQHAMLVEGVRKAVLVGAAAKKGQSR